MCLHDVTSPNKGARTMVSYKPSKPIATVESTKDTLSGRGGLALFVRYLSGIGIYPILQRFFGPLRKSKKGLPIWNLFLQVFCFFLDGTSKHLVDFDHRAKDDGYAATVENSPAQMASSHTIKRFFQSFGRFAGGVFRKILNQLFVWRLKIERPGVVEMTIDTMVMDNDEAQKRQGVQPTYKKVKGFQPLQMIWKGKIIDAIFRGGKKNGNAGNTVRNMLERAVKLIRKTLREDVLIILRVDAGFFDQKILQKATKLGVGIIMTGKMYETVKEHVDAVPEEEWAQYSNGKQQWQYTEFEWGCDNWAEKYRAFYTRTMTENGQGLLEFARPEGVLLTNLGIEDNVLSHCTPEQRQHWLDPETIIASHHGRGADELPHRGLKDFGFEEMPFQSFSANQSFYYCMVIAFFLYETFKEDVLAEVIPVTSYATTVRRKVIDIAIKITHTGGQTILKIPRALMKSLRFDRLWAHCNTPPTIPAMDI